MMQTFDPDALNAVIDNSFGVPTEAARLEPLLRPVLMHNATLSGFSLATPPEDARPNGADLTPRTARATPLKGIHRRPCRAQLLTYAAAACQVPPGET